MRLVVERYQEDDCGTLAAIWNQVVEDGEAFPQAVPMGEEEARTFFARQDFVGVSRRDGEIVGLYILHPNNVGRCGHQANASYAVKRSARGLGVGEMLVSHSLTQAKALGYRLMIFNAVVKGNDRAIHLYEKLGFVRIGTVPGGFLAKGGDYRDTILFYHTL